MADDRTMAQGAHPPRTPEVPDPAAHHRIIERIAQDGEGFYRALFEVNPAMKLLLCPETGTILDANQAAVAFYGWPLEVLRTMSIFDINTLTRDEVEAEMVHARSGKRRYFRFRHRTARGEVRHVEVYTGPVPVGDQQVLLSIIHDVTERDAFEAQLRQVQRLEAVGRLAGGVAHDFNNLLTIMLGAASAMEQALPAEHPATPHLGDLRHAAKRATDLTRQLLAFSRRQVMRPRMVDLSGVIDGLRGFLQRSLGAAYVLDLDLAPDLPRVQVDPGQMEQVLMNLALNARDAMPHGGRIAIRTRTTSVPPPVAPSEAERWVVLQVDDDGAGMDQETAARAFEPFFTTKGETDGTGLGLATVYGIVAQSGGHIGLETDPGEGTRVTIHLPTVEDAPPHG